MQLAFAPRNDTPFESWYGLSKKYGFKAVNINGLQLYNKIGQEVLSKGLQISQLAVWGYNPLSPKVEDFEEVKKFIDIAGAFDFKCSVTFGSGGYSSPNPFVAHPDNWTKEARKKAVENIKPLVEYAEKKGVMISLEPHTGNVTNNIENTLETIELIGSKCVGVTLDIVNYCTVEGYYNTTSLIDEYASSLKECIVEIHLKDVIMRPELIVHMDECPAGFGNLNLVHFLKKMDNILGDDHWAILEHTPYSQVGAAFENVLNAAREAGVRFR